VLSLRVADDLRAIDAGDNDEPGVVVDAQEVDGRRDRGQIAVFDERRSELVALEEIRRIGAAEDWIQEPAVALAVDLPGSGLVLRGFGRRVDLREVERDPDARVRGGGADRFRGPAVREEKVMCGRDGVPLARAARRVLARRVADPGVDPGLVVRDPVVNSVAQAARDGCRVVDECRRSRAQPR
jgi:hypothetical protein